MQLYVADYLGDTRHLTTEQHGAYLLILMTMWRHNGTLAADAKTLSRVACLTMKRWRLMEPILMAFFTVEDGRIKQKRLSKEFQKAVSKSELRSLLGELGAAAKALKNKEPPLAKGTLLLKQGQKSEVIKQSSSDATRDPLARVMELLEANPADTRWASAPSILRRWEDAGYDFDRIVWPVLSERVATIKAQGRTIPQSLKYFDGAITDRAAEKPMAKAAAQTGPDPRAPESDAKALARMREWAAGNWYRDQWGPTPAEPGCLIPEHVRAA